MERKETIRLNKFISDSGYCSRREADQYIENRQVYVNGRIAKVGQHVQLHDQIVVNNIEIKPRDKEMAIYIALNKPVGITCTTDPNDPTNIIDFLSFGERIFPIGRLDKDSQGLILLTSDGDIVNKILRAGNKHEKEYIVTVDKPITDDFCTKMENGVPILGVNTKKCTVEKLNTNTFKIILIQGLNRQIRRMCEYFDYRVTKLERTRIMNIDLNVPIGQYRDLTKEELMELKRLTAQSEQHEKAKANKKTAKKKSTTKKTVLEKDTTPKKRITRKPKSQPRIGKSKPPEKPKRKRRY
ncbi:Ribosomal large subunit pseudouridine synthase F [Weeksella virosa]|uniref:23S rRNA pseudouridine(2604) synthase RluF n=1 Tax=Weeksella virosa TaxID=1014 RepID=UPI000DFDC5B8|nr:23S rRNA pseudouridine(2604) synthase RluF [Weeksella virosa]SUP54166.1 Ribosomal large subunit pseudouridine synthase F [Weeksella virosa]